MKKPAAIESTIDINFGSRQRLRIWRSESALQMVYQNDDIIRTIREMDAKGKSARDILEFVASMDRVAAVQLINEHPNYLTGVVVYTEWP